MAPELYDENYDEKVDIYAFGMVAQYFILGCPGDLYKSIPIFRMYKPSADLQESYNRDQTSGSESSSRY